MSSFDQKIVNRILTKSERAQRHIYDLQGEWDAFKKSNHYRVVHEDDPNIGQRIYRICDVWEIPDKISIIAGDAVHNIRCALDHLVYQMVFFCTSGRGPFNNLYFPIGKDLEDFLEKIKRASECKIKSNKIIQRLRPEAIEAIKAVEAYQGGDNGILWHLHRLDIIDKHYLLIAAGSLNHFKSMPPRQIAYLKRNFLGVTEASEFNPVIDARDFLSESTSAPFPLKPGDEIYRVPLSEVDENINFSIDVAFLEPEIVKGKAILEVLGVGLDTVNMIIRDFAMAGLVG